MAKPLRPKRGTTAKNDAFTGLASEITIDTDKHSIRVHDGVTAGGHEILPKAKNDLLYEKAGRNPNDFLITATGTPDARTLSNRFADTVNVKDFGAVGDGVTDDTAAIQAALDYARLNSKRVVGQGNFLVTSTISIRCSCDLSDAVFVADGTVVSPVIAVGAKTWAQGQILSNKVVKLPSVENSAKPYGQPGWSGLENSVGIQFYAAVESEFHLRKVQNFYTGIWCSGYGTCLAYNTFYLGHLFNNNVQLKIFPLNDTKTDGAISYGWVNQNIFIGGRFHVSVDEGSDNGQTQLLIRANSEQGYIPNNNTFIGACLESHLTDYAIDAECSDTLFLNCRFEGSERVRFYAGPNRITRRNEIHGGYGIADLNVVQETEGGRVEYNAVVGPNVMKYNLQTRGLLNCKAYNAPVLQGCQYDIDPTGPVSENQWHWRLNRNSIELKQYSAADRLFADMRLIGNSIYFGNGTSELNNRFYCNANYNSFYIGPADTTTTKVGTFQPTVDGLMKLGYASYRWSEVFSSTGAINTSDERSKTNIHNPDDALMRAWAKVNFKVFQFKDAYETKGDNARLHVGVVAQQVIEAFASEGLDATRYGLLCYDKWDDQYEDVEVIDQEEVVDEKGEVVIPAKAHVEQKLVIKAGDSYGIRYEEALALECAYQRWRMDKLEKRLS